MTARLRPSPGGIEHEISELLQIRTSDAFCDPTQTVGGCCRFRNPRPSIVKVAAPVGGPVIGLLPRNVTAAMNGRAVSMFESGPNLKLTCSQSWSPQRIRPLKGYHMIHFLVTHNTRPISSSTRSRLLSVSAKTPESLSHARFLVQRCCLVVTNQVAPKNCHHGPLSRDITESFLHK